MRGLKQSSSLFGKWETGMVMNCGLGHDQATLSPFKSGTGNTTGVVVRRKSHPLRLKDRDLLFPIRDIEPGQPVLFSLEFSHEEEMDKLRKAGLIGCIGKLYNGAALSKLKNTNLNERKKG